jgi:hypothetical protein
MQKQDLDDAAQLFEAVGDGVDEDVWMQRFQMHIAQAMRKHSGRLRQGGNATAQQLEVLRARLELHDVVADRLESRVERCDPELAKRMKDLRRLQADIMSEVFETAAGLRDDHGNGHRQSRPPSNGTSPGPGAGVFTNAAKTNGTEASPGIGSFDDYADSSLQDSTANNSPLVANSVRALGQTKHYGSIHQSRASSDKAYKPAKELSLRQLRDIMTSVYASKLQDDARRTDLQEPLITMEQFLYSFLGKRYGLKSVVHEWSTAIFRTIQKYAQKEMDVMVFGKILQNKLSESFASVQDTLRATVQMLLRNNIQLRHPGRNQPELDEMWRQLMKAVPRMECDEVVRYMYNDRDCVIVLERLAKECQDGNGESDYISYKAFIHILLSFQMNLTEGFLTDFVAISRQVDTTGHGTLNPAQLEELVRNLARQDLPEGLPEAHREIQEIESEILARIRQVRSATFSESVDLCTPLISARWELVGEQPLAAS